MSEAYYSRVMTPSRRLARRVSQVFKNKSKALHASIQSTSQRASRDGAPRALFASPLPASSLSSSDGKAYEAGERLNEGQGTLEEDSVGGGEKEKRDPGVNVDAGSIMLLSLIHI